MELQVIDKREVKENQIETFSNKLFGEIRAIRKDGQPWFVGKDVAEKLGYKNTRDALITKVDEEDKVVVKCDTIKGKQNTTIINESGLYSLVLSSKLPSAKEFKRWVTSEVLPAIRQTGGYIPHNEEMSDDEIMARALQVAQRTIERKNEQLRLAEEEIIKLAGTIEQQKPKLEYLDEILSCDDALLVTSIAFDYGLSAQALNKILCEERVQRKVRSQYILYSEYLGKGYTKTETKMIGDKPRVQTLWTQKGRMLIHEILTRRNIKATMDLELVDA